MEVAKTDVVTKPLNYNLFFDNGYINYESPLSMLISAGLWRCLYCIFRFFLHKQPPEFCCRIISFLHGCISAFMGINQCFLFDSPFNHPEWKTSYVQSFIMTMSLGYFVHDTAWLLKYDTTDKTMLYHHIFCVLSLVRILFKGYSGAQATCSLGSMELTNPFLQARWFLRTAGMQSAPVFKSTEITFFLIFVFVRIILGSYFLIIILRQPKNDWDFLFMSIGIYVISWIFVWGMIKYVMKKYTGTSTTTTNGPKNE